MSEVSLETETKKPPPQSMPQFLTEKDAKEKADNKKVFSVETYHSEDDTLEILAYCSTHELAQQYIAMLYRTTDYEPGVLEITQIPVLTSVAELENR